MRRPRNALTKVELITVLCWLILIVGLTIVAVQQVRTRASDDRCNDNLRKLALACHRANDTLGSLPPYDSRPMPPNNVYSYNGTTYGSVFYHLLPFLDKAALYEDGRFLAIPFAHGWGYSVNVVQGSGGPIPDFPIPDAVDLDPNSAWSRILGVVQPSFICPSDPSARQWGSICSNGWAGTSYGANFLVFGNQFPEDVNDPDGLGGIGKTGQWGAKAVIPASFPDGLSNTLLFGEKYVVCGDGTEEGAQTTGSAWAWANHSSAFAAAVAMELPWSDGTKFQILPSPSECDNRYAQTGHQNGMHLVLADGSARDVHPILGANAYQYLMQPNDGTMFGNGDW
jgi:hypothetical protein